MIKKNFSVLDGNIQLPVYLGSFLKFEPEKIIQLYQDKQLTRIPGLSILLGVQTMHIDSKPLYSNSRNFNVVEMKNYKCEKFTTYKDMKFKTSEINTFKRENELILKMNNRKRPKIREMGEFLAE